jgi:type 1 glutamine amidotransferase
MHKLFAAALAGLLAAACSDPNPAGPIPGGGGTPIRVLMVTATLGFRHGSIPVAREVISGLGAPDELSVTATETPADITAARLAGTDVLMFALTSGELPFDDAQKAAILAFVSGGGGFIGIHSATDTLYGWPEYGRLVGAYFNGHPWTQEAAVLVEDRDHPSTAPLGASFRLTEEFYTFRDNPRPLVRVLLSLDAASVGASGDFPLAWSQTVGQGRSYYNALGHFDGTWRDARFQAQLLGAIRWTARRD